MSIDALFAWVATVADLGVVVSLGLIMAARWIGVYRRYGAPDSSTLVRVPPERHFPRSVVAVHGILAVSTVVLVVLSVLFDGS
jgi:manganese efflux pump family protein